MLGTRTKQVFAYGKRQHRIVNISDERDSTDPFSIMNTSTSVSRAPAASRMRKRENAPIAKTAESPSPQMVKPRIHRKKWSKPLSSPPPDPLTKAKKHTLLENVIAAEATTDKTPDHLPSTASHVLDHATPTHRSTRTPLGSFPLNIPEETKLENISTPQPLESSSILQHAHHSKTRESWTRVARTSPPPLIQYQNFPSPYYRPRQLTPIRGASRSRFGHFIKPPTPTTPSDFDLSFQLSNLNLIDPSHLSNDLTSQHIFTEAPPEYLLPLLSECVQETCGPHEFSAFIEMFPFDPIVRNNSTGAKAFQKIGEASFSEVFGIGDVVLKIIPLRDETANEVDEKRPTPTLALDRGRPDGKYGNVSWNAKKEVAIKGGPPPSDTKDVVKEIIVTRAMGEMCEGFVKLLRAYVVRGKYPEVLLELWDEYFERRGSESVRPDTFSVSQIYAIIVLPNGGPDLESYSFSSANRYGWRQACSLFWQVARSLSQAEQLVSFEHRDLHWGQILVKEVPSANLMPLKPKTLSEKLQPVAIDQPVYGVRATLIDLGLSRMDAGDGAGGVRVHWTPFAEEIFTGEGDYQFDVYRMMRQHTQGAWEDFKPLTNVMWLHYVVLRLLHYKRLKPPPSSRKAPPRPPAAFTTEKQCYDCLTEIETILSNAIQALVPKVLPNRKGRRKTQAPVRAQTTYYGPQSASDIIGYALKRGWLL